MLEELTPLSTPPLPPATEPVVDLESVPEVSKPSVPEPVVEAPVGETVDPRVSPVVTGSPEDDSKKLGGDKNETDTAQMVGNEPQEPKVEPQNGSNQSPSAVLEPKESPKPAPASHPESLNKPAEFIKSLFIKAKQTIQLRKQKKLNKIIAYVNERQSISNDQVEKLLHVSDATASRYLNKLVKEGSLIMAGKGRSTYYIKK